jgi:acylphosphatase
LPCDVGHGEYHAHDRGTPMSVARARVVYGGYVQSVGFRYTARRLAKRFPISGWVRNLPDGTVELEAQGDRHEVESFLEGLRSDMKDNVREAKTCWIGALNGEATFDVRF